MYTTPSPGCRWVCTAFGNGTRASAASCAFSAAVLSRTWLPGTTQRTSSA